MELDMAMVPHMHIPFHLLKMQIMDTWEWTWDMAMVPHHIHNPFHLLKNEESFSHTCTQYGLKILPNKIEEEKQS